MMKKSRLFLPALILLLFGCKPTERNYQNAYTKAYEASQRRTQEMTSGFEGAVLESMDAPGFEIVEGDTLYLSTGRFAPFESESEPAGRLGIAVGRYSMPTNARRQAQDLSAKFPGSMMVTDGEENYYVLIGTASSLGEAAVPLRYFKKLYPEYTYIGLNGKPLIVTLTP